MGTDRTALADVLELAEIEAPTWIPCLAALWASGTPMNAGDADDDGAADDADDADADDAPTDDDAGSDDDSDDAAADDDSDDEIAANGKDPAKVKRTLAKLRARIKTLENETAGTKTKKQPGKAESDDAAADDDTDLGAEKLRADRAEVAADTGVPRTILQLVGATNRDELEKAAEALKKWRDEGPASATDDLDGGAKPRPTTADDPATLAKSVSRGW